jgi:large subunit ribosomal protein L19
VSAHEKIRNLESKYLRKGLPAIEVGDTIKMNIKVAEADKIRVHPFEGTIIRITRGGLHSAFTVRKISFGEGVERTFPLNSPVIDSINVISKGRVKRARLYYLRGRLGKKTKVETRQETTPEQQSS